MTDFERDFEETVKKGDECVSQYSANRRMLKNQMERKVRRSQIWLRRFKIFAKLLTIFLMLFFSYKLLWVHQWYLPKSTYDRTESKHLEILNNKIVSSSKVLAALRRTKIPTKPIYLVETDEIKKSVMQLDPVANVYVRRFWFPGRLQIIVQERVPVISISPSEEVEPIAFFARGGKLIGRDYLPLDPSFKTYLVLSYGVKGDDYRNWDNEKITSIEKLAKAIEEITEENIEYIDFRDPKDIYVKLPTAKIRLGELDEGVFERIKRIPSILPQVKTLDKKIKYIDLRWKDANYIKLED